MNKIIELAHLHPQPFCFSETERRDPVQADYGSLDRRTPNPFRGSRQPSLEPVRYMTLTLQDILEAVQNHWPHDRTQPLDLQTKLHFGAYAISRVRNGELRRMAENAQT